ncbi:hypothetical protein [Paenibacillus glycanilyticus]|uniref:Phospholipase C/D domain-containing protein n=1 Tax=Paenibacillus glycanilyticus TaxID=126569 RepID=A0ABQ6GIN9_9BACL|nr:hypothetical protein [Paenibacillus glycanilyticus]GLX70557.1 hypothetical protein MU1_49030 [Paenibacillus glycanilyticus]
MGSRMMHYCMTSEINKFLYSSKESRIHLGGLAPDLTHPVYAPKSVTHFVQINSAGIKRTDYEYFARKYKENFDDSFYVGYLSHLVADNIWYETMYLKLIKSLPEEKRQAAIDKGYRDFRRLNKLLLRYYPVSPPTEIPVIDNVRIDGLYPEYLPVITEQLIGDFHIEEPVTPDDLEIYNLDAILEYVRLSIEETLKVIHTGLLIQR